MNAAELKSTLETIVKNHGLEIRTQCGDIRGTKVVYPKVVAHKDGAVHVAFETFGDEKRCAAVLVAVRKEFAKTPGSEKTLKVKKLGSTGYWNMGRFNATDMTSTHYSTDWKKAC